MNFRISPNPSSSSRTTPATTTSTTSQIVRIKFDLSTPCIHVCIIRRRCTRQTPPITQLCRNGVAISIQHRAIVMNITTCGRALAPESVRSSNFKKPNFFKNSPLPFHVGTNWIPVVVRLASSASINCNFPPPSLHSF